MSRDNKIRPGCAGHRIAALAGVVAAASAVPFAHAHPGGHAHMSWPELIQHYAEPDHLAFLALAVIVGWLAFRWGRRVEAKARSRDGADKNGNRRP